MTVSRRTFIKSAAFAAGAATGLAQWPAHAAYDYKISLAAYSLHRTIGPGKTPMLELPRLAREEFGLDAVELVNWMLESSQPEYVDTFIANAQQHNVEILLIMVDRAGAVGGMSERSRNRAVDMHSEWIDIAQKMGCHSIRMNWAGARANTMADPAKLDEFIQRSVDPLRRICEYGDSKDINVIIENHGGPSSHPDALVTLMEAVNHPRFGTLPDFGNFPPRVDPNGGPMNVDKYEAVDKMMPYAKAVSAKCYDFDPQTGAETTLDYPRLINTVAGKHGYSGYIGIEYEGVRMSEFEGVHACKKLLERLRTADG